jgi:hypothetical protein
LSENGHIRDNTEVVLYETTFAILTYRVEKWRHTERSLILCNIMQLKFSWNLKEGTSTDNIWNHYIRQYLKAEILQETLVKWIIQGYRHVLHIDDNRIPVRVSKLKTILQSLIWASKSSDYEGFCILGCNTMQSSTSQLMYWRNILPPLRGWRVNLARNQ